MDTPSPAHAAPDHVVDGESGFSTAELLGNAALGIAALVVIWGLLTNVGSQVITFIQTALGIG
jgi:hypothetical protein